MKQTLRNEDISDANAALPTICNHLRHGTDTLSPAFVGIVASVVGWGGAASSDAGRTDLGKPVCRSPIQHLIRIFEYF